MKGTLVKNTPFDLTGKVAVITGSSRGIGRSSAVSETRAGVHFFSKFKACPEPRKDRENDWS